MNIPRSLSPNFSKKTLMERCCLECSTQCMAAGIDASACFMVFITREYIRKCAERGAEDNCHAE